MVRLSLFCLLLLSFVSCTQVANKGSDKYYIQSAYSIEDNNKKEQELQSLLNIGDNFKKMVIVYDSFIKWQDDNGIIYISIYDFLLNENSLKEA